MDARSLKSILENRFGNIKVITVDGNPRSLIVRTDAPTARILRSEGEISGPEGIKLIPLLTSGAIGKLKRRAMEAGANGKIHER